MVLSGVLAEYASGRLAQVRACFILLLVLLLWQRAACAVVSRRCHDWRLVLQEHCCDSTSDSVSSQYDGEKLRLKLLLARR
jgi:hypothetical protein